MIAMSLFDIDVGAHSAVDYRLDLTERASLSNDVGIEWKLGGV
jgi:hypothetical protein